MSDALARVLAAVRAAVPELDPAGGERRTGTGPHATGLDGTALAEALWLAARMAEPRPDPRAPARPPSDAPRDTEPVARGGTPPEAPPRRPPTPPPDPAVPRTPAPPAVGAHRLHERLPGAGAPLRGHAVAAPRATGLPRALEVTRALRPWKRPWPEGRHGALDIDATVDGYARSGELLPVFSAAPERWFDLALVVDRSPHMRVWEETLDDFTAVLDRLGAFRTLQVRDLLFDGDGRPRAPGQLRRADGRRLVVVVSDCMAAAWRGPAVWRLLREWAATTPMALLNPLPTKLWRRGGLNLPTVRFTPAAPGAHRSRLPHEPPPLLDLPAADFPAPDGRGAPGGTPTAGSAAPVSPAEGRARGGSPPDAPPSGGTEPGRTAPREAAPDEAAPDGGEVDDGGRDEGAWLPIPVLSLSPHSLDRWSRAAMRGAPEGCTAVLVPPGGRPPGRPRPPATPLPPARAAQGFLRTAAPRAVRLAVLCSPFDRLSLPLLHVIRRELVPEATTGDVAEVVTSGLFGLEEPAGAAGPLTLVLPDEARAVLRERLAAHEAWRVHQALDRYVASGGDGPARLPSVARDTSGPRELPAGREAFAHASRQTLELLGLAAPARREPEGADGGEPAAGTEGAGSKGAWSSLPPGPSPFVGRVEEVRYLVEQLAAPRGRVHWVTALVGAPGAGRTALALHVAHRVRAHYPDGGYHVDLRGSSSHPVPPEAALHRLLTDLGAPPGEGPHTAEELAAGLASALAGRRVLLVLDDAPDPDRLRPLLPSEPGCSVIVTTRARQPLPGVQLTPLRGTEAHALLTAATGATGALRAAGTAAAQGGALPRELTEGRSWWPAALRVVGSWIASGSAPPAPEVARLLRAARPADAPAPPAEELGAVLRLRLGHLPADVSTALRLLARAETGAFAPDEASALLESVPRPDAMLGRLVTEGLLERPAPGVYRMPQVVHHHLRHAYGHDAEVADAAPRLLRRHLAAAAALYQERRPGSALHERLGVASRRIDGAAYDTWVSNALASADPVEATEGPASPGPRRLADLLLLLHDAGATTPYRSRHEAAAESVMRATAAGDRVAHVRAGLALALAQHAAREPLRAARSLTALGPRPGRDDPATGAVAVRLAGTLADGRRADKEAMEHLEEAVTASRADGDRFALAEACVALARVLTRLGWTSKAVGSAREALGCFPGPEPHPLTEEALTCLEQALDSAGRYEEALAAQQRLREALRTRGAPPAEEGRLLTRVARALLALGRAPEAEAAAREALARLDGADDDRLRAEADRLVAEARSGRADRDAAGRTAWTVVAMAAEGGDEVEKLRILTPVVEALEEGGVLTRRHRRRWEADRDACLLYVDPEVPLDRLTRALAERLPARLEADGERPAARLAVHTASLDPQDGGPGSELDIRLTLAMLRSAEFRKVSENFPFHPTFCLSPEAFGRLTARRPAEARGASSADALAGRSRDGHGPRPAEELVAGLFVPREVTGGTGEAMCVILTPHLDLSVYDAELLMLARVFNDLDPDGSRFAAIVRECLDAALDPEATGRFDLADLDAEEKARVGPLLERELRRAFPAATPFRLRLSLGWPNWSFREADEGGVFLVVRADDERARWSAGLLRMRPGMRVAPVHRGAPSPLTSKALLSVLWLHRGAALPENVLLRMAETDRRAVLAPPSATQRAAELFRRVRERPVPDAALRAVTRRRDSARRVREAAAVLRDEGVLVLGGNRRGRELAAVLRLPEPDPHAYVSVRLTRRRPHHTGPSVVAGGVAWVVAGPGDPVEPLPQELPSPRRPR
ncbi:NaeI family type II restriction endonuclease [Streptomyces sp. DH12]|uniref:NaeI family type II restriction endonuclease n=1 Tax=Streptomyces sp. DH12 TaxID=2857010 RepID=UPI001E3DF1F9|nr:NaeI family type II restriction endonuclease [Streptomyces sp. DH12]